jgi:hypothetical protein
VVQTIDFRNPGEHGAANERMTAERLLGRLLIETIQKNDAYLEAIRQARASMPTFPAQCATPETRNCLNSHSTPSSWAMAPKRYASGGYLHARTLWEAASWKIGTTCTPQSYQTEQKAHSRKLDFQDSA